MNKGKHERGHEQHGNERHAANQLHIQGAQSLDGGHVGATAQRHKNGQRKRQRHGDDGEHDRERKAAPLVGVHLGQAHQAALHEDEINHQHEGPNEGQSLVPKTRHAADDHHAKHEGGGNHRTPMLGLRVTAHHNQTAFFGDHTPASPNAAHIIASLQVGAEHGMHKSPVHGRN
jgi:hypothetical protein